jgi:flagellar hook-basal body complex protein FliE
VSNTIAGSSVQPLSYEPRIAPQPGAAPRSGGFEEVLRSAIDQVDTLQANSEQQVGELLQGERGDIHNVMIAIEKADVAFQLMMQVMQHLSNMEEVGRGIAVAFVATIYGVGAANLIFLPCAGKLKIRLRQQQIVRDMTLDGVISILEGMNPHMLEGKLLGYLREHGREPHEHPETKLAA